MSATFIGTCVGLPAAELEAYDDTERSITYAAFFRHVGKEIVQELNAAFGVPLRKDWAASFGKGLFCGKPAVCLHHSGIHHLYALLEKPKRTPIANDHINRLFPSGLYEIYSRKQGRFLKYDTLAAARKALVIDRKKTT